MTLYVLNTLITPIDFDKKESAVVRFRKITPEEAKNIVKSEPFKSAVGHEGTAKLLSEIFETNVPFNRETIFMDKGDKAVHFFLKERLPEGAVLSKDALKNLRYWIILSEVIE